MSQTSQEMIKSSEKSHKVVKRSPQSSEKSHKKWQTSAKITQTSEK